MLWVEAVSVLLIAFVIGIVLVRHGWHLDSGQVGLRGVSPTGLRLGVMLALFSFVGFESATTLGEEAKEPLKTIPRAVIRSALLAGVFFIVCAYGEVLGFRFSGHNLGESVAPLHYLSTSAGVPIIGHVIDVGVLVSMFAATLACVIAAARVLMLMAHHGLAHGLLRTTHKSNETPGAASILVGVLAFLPTAVLAERGTSGADIYGWMGTLAVYGFLTAYLLVALALPIHLRRHHRLGAGGILLSGVAGVSAVFAILGTVFPVPPPPYKYFPYLYAAYLSAGLIWYAAYGRRRTVLA
jgi:amino acid transporter